MTSRLVLLALAALSGHVVLAQEAKQRASDKPLFELRAGDRYYRADGIAAFMLGRNPVGMSPKAYDDHFRHAEAAGERFMRIHFTYSPPEEKAGDIDAGVLKAWDEILEAAGKRGLALLPVLGVWADWNDGSRGETWHTWDKNAFNADRGGPAKRPDELLKDTACRKLWLARLEKIVKRWAPRRNIVGWEIFSEVDLITGSTEARAIEFVERAAAVIRAADPLKRPITASQAGVNEWPKLLKSDALDFIQVHPYADGLSGGRLDELILSTVRDRRTKYGKPVLLGECGLDSAPPRGTLDAAPRAEIGIRHAIWASVVSGAMNGRMLWWQDGYDQFEKADLCRLYHEAAAPAAAFVRGIDFTSFMPVDCTTSAGLKGAVLGNDRVRLAWCRDANCSPPGWPLKKVAGDLTLDAAGDSWQVEFFDTTTGKSIRTQRLPVDNGRLRVKLPPFEGSVAVRMKATEEETKAKAKVPIVLDTDIGGDIDDALALGLVLTSPELELRGVTTVDGDAYTRALIVCRLLDVLERGKIPVASGAPPRQVPDFSGQMQYGLRPAHKRPVKESAVEFLDAQLKATPGELTIVCIGPLTNIAALLEKHPAAAKQIERLVIMGGSIRVGYNGRPPAEAEWNIKSDVKAAQKVFASGVAITLVPLDTTATLALGADPRKKMFAAGTVLGHHLNALYQLWGKETPILFDPAAVAACLDESLLKFERLRIAVDDKGMTAATEGNPNAQVATSGERDKLAKVFLDRITRPALSAADLPKALVLHIDANSQYFLLGNRLELDPLARLLKEASTTTRPESLLVKAHGDAVYERLSRALDATSAAKIENIKIERSDEQTAPTGKAVSQGGFPARVHVVENYETDIEGRWWLAGKLETKNVPPGSTRACRAVLTNDFDDLQGDKYAIYKAVIFNPVPGPPMGPRTRLAFRYHLTGTDSLRMQIYTLTKGYHRQLTVKGLEQGRWAEATVDITQARRPDGSGGSLSEDERIDDIQFYADPAAELLIDDIVLYDAADEGADERGADVAKAAKEKRPFPKQIVFTGWFDTGKQGAEWPGDFEIVPHKPPLKWKAAKAVAAPDGKSQWIRVDLRGPRPLPAEARLRFRYFLRGAKILDIELGVAGIDRRGTTALADAKENTWAEADIDLSAAVRSLPIRDKAERAQATAIVARDIAFRTPNGAELLVDDVLLYDGGKEKPPAAK